MTIKTTHRFNTALLAGSLALAPAFLAATAPVGWGEFSAADIFSARARAPTDHVVKPSRKWSGDVLASWAKGTAAARTGLTALGACGAGIAHKTTSAAVWSLRTLVQPKTQTALTWAGPALLGASALGPLPLSGLVYGMSAVGTTRTLADGAKLAKDTMHASISPTYPWNVLKSDDNHKKFDLGLRFGGAAALIAPVSWSATALLMAGVGLARTACDAAGALLPTATLNAQTTSA